MGSRGQKRMETTDNLPSDKRACSSTEFRTSTSTSSVQTQISSTKSMTETHHRDVDPASSASMSASASASSRSEGEQEKDSSYWSGDSEPSGKGEPSHRTILDYQQMRSSDNHGKLKRILTNLNEGSEASAQLAILAELCEVLSFCTEDSMSRMMADSLSPILVKLAMKENNPDIMLLAIRAMTYLCDVFSRASTFLARHGAVATLCRRLMAIDYLDVAEQCLQVLEKISRDEALACLRAGAVAAVLKYVDFFSRSIQRVALSTVVNICKELPSNCPSNCPSSVMEAVPILCNLLRYEDRELVENAVLCLVKIVDRLSNSSEMLNVLCQHGLVHQATHLLGLKSHPIYLGLIGLLVKLASGSSVAFRTLFELNISNTLKDILSTYDTAHGRVPSQMVGEHLNQVDAVLKLLNVLLPAVSGDQDAKQLSEKELFLVNHPEVLQKFGMALFPKLIQVVNSGADVCICYGCLSIMNKLVYLSKPYMLLELLKNTNISSFLAGVFTRKDHHVLILALQIVEAVFKKLPDYFLNPFVKDGVFFAVDALLGPEKCPQVMFPLCGHTQFSADANQKPPARRVMRCLCYAFDTGQSAFASEVGTCKLDKDSLYNLANHIRTNYFSSEYSKNGLTDSLQKFRNLSDELTNLVNISLNDNCPLQHEEKSCSVLHQMLENFVGIESISTFEFIESGIVNSLVNFLSNGMYVKEEGERDVDMYSHLSVIEKRFKVFAKLLFCPSNHIVKDPPLLILTRQLQSALCLLENFPVILSSTSKHRHMYASIPYGRCMTHPCLKIRLLRGEGETLLSDYSEDVFTVDPFSSLKEVGEFLWPKVGRKKAQVTGSVNQHVEETIGEPSAERSLESKHSHLVDSDSVSSASPAIQEGTTVFSRFISEEAHHVREPNLRETSETETHNRNAEEEVHFPLETDVRTEAQYLRPSNTGNGSPKGPKLLFYLGGNTIDSKLTVYQTILQHQMKSDPEIVADGKLWTQVYTLTYRQERDTYQKKGWRTPQQSTLSDKVGKYWQCSSFLSRMFNYELASELDKSGPTFNMLMLLKCLESMNRFRFHLISSDRLDSFADGRIDHLGSPEASIPTVPEYEFVSCKLTEKLEQQMRDPLVGCVGSLPLWYNQLMVSFPFLFGFEAKCKYFRLAGLDRPQVQPRFPSQNTGVLSEQRSNVLPRKRFVVNRRCILNSATKMMDLHANHKGVLEVEYEEEVGTGLGPTLEFYTLISHEFQKSGLHMWRENACFGFFPQPWPSLSSASKRTEFSEVIPKFVLLGQVVARALQDGRVLDIPFSGAFYKHIVGQELSAYDIQSFDPELSRALLEFKALVDRKKLWDFSCKEDSTPEFVSCFRNARFEDLSLDFTLPGYPDYILASGPEYKLVNMDNLEEYVSLIVDATIHSGISRQFEAFKSGFNQVFPIERLQIFNEVELESLLCGTRDLCDSGELSEHIKFDHGYTASSPPIVYLLELVQEFDSLERRAFLQFVTGAPRLPLGGLAALNPKLTVVRKHSSVSADADLPSVMTCANYLKLPPYTSKERMKEKLFFAITEGQGSFHLS